MLLVLIGSVTDFAEAMQEHGTRQAIAGLALVELLPSRAAQFGIVDPVEREQCALMRPSSRRAAARPFCRGYEASCRMMSDAVTVPVRMDAMIRRISDQWARMSSTLMRPAIIGSSAG